MEPITFAVVTKFVTDKINPFLPLADKVQKSGADYLAMAHSLKTYPRNLQHRYGKLTIQGLSGYNSIDLLDIFVEQNAAEKLDIGQSEQEDKNDDLLEKSELALNVLRKEEHRCMVILGDPGSGKSTLVQYLALDWARWADKELKQFGGHKMTIDSYLEPYLAIIGQGKTPKQFPILIELGEYIKNRKEGESFREYWYRGVAADRKLNKEKLTDLNNKNISVIFDGLNEIDDRRLYSYTVNNIIQFANHHPLTKIIVTSRKSDYDGKVFENANFWHFELEDFDDSRKRYLVDKWCDLIIEKDKNDGKRKIRSKKISRNRKKANLLQATDKQGGENKTGEKERLLRELQKFNSISGKPQFLMMMLGILDAQDSLPSEQELYARLSKMLLASSNENVIDRREKQVILGLIAYKMQFGFPESEDGNSINYESLKRLLIKHLEDRKFKDPRAIAVQTIEELKSDRFIACGNTLDVYNFVNSKFLAYFCAKEVKRQHKTFSLLASNIFSRYWQYESRHESLRSICGVLDTEHAVKLVSYLMENVSVDRVDCLDEKNLATKAAIQHLVLARECLAAIKDYHYINSKINAELKTKLEIEIEKSGISLNKEAAKILTDSIAKHYRNEPDTLTRLKNIALNNGGKFVRSAAVQSIAEYYHYKDDDILEWLGQVATGHPDELAQRESVRSIADYYHTKKDLKLDPWPGSRSNTKCNLLTWLQDCAYLASNELARRESVRAIAKYYYHNTSDILEWLRDCAMQDSHPWVRASAVQALASYYSNEPDTLKWLQDLAFNDVGTDVRRAAVRSIAQYYRIEESDPLIWDNNSPLRENSHPLIWLRDSALGHKNLDVKKLAIESIAKYYSKDKETLTLIKNIAENKNEDKSIQAIAVKSIAKYYRQEPDLLKWLKEQALKNDELVRAAATQSILLHYHQESDTLEWFQSINMGSGNNVWKPIVESIAKYYYKEPNTLEWLEKIALDDNLNESVRIIAVESIAKYYYKESNTLQRLRYLLTSSKNGKKSQQNQKTVKSIAVKSIAKYYYKNPDTLKWLQDQAKEEQYPLDVRIAAVEMVALYYHNKSDTLEWLKKIVSSPILKSSQDDRDNQKKIKSIAVESIAKYYYKESDKLKWLQDQAKEEQYPLDVRIAIVEMVALYYHNKSDTLEWLKKIVSSPILKSSQDDRDNQKKVKSIAVESIAKYYPQELEWLKKYATTSDLEEVAQDSISKTNSKLIDRYQESLESLKDRAFGNDKEQRCTAVELIGKYHNKEASLSLLFWKMIIFLQVKPMDAAIDEIIFCLIILIIGILPPYTLKLLEDIAVKVPGEDVKLAAVKSIAKYYRKYPYALTLLKKIAFTDFLDPDREADVRQIAKKSISKYYYQKELGVLNRIQDVDNPLYSFGLLDVEHAAARSISKPYYQVEKNVANSIQDIANIPYINPSYYVESIEKNFNIFDFNLLKELVVNHPDSSIQLQAIEKIAKHYRKENRALEWLKDIAVKYDIDRDIRVFTVKSIVKYYRKEDGTLKWLKGIAIQSHDPNVRRIAVESIARYFYKKEKESNPLSSLQKWVVEFKDEVVWRAALESIPKYYKYDKYDEICTLEWLKDLTLCNERDLLKRSAALQSIAKCYWNESDTLKWLKKIAGDKDEDISLRSDAVKSIAQYYHKKPEILTWLKEERFLYKENNPKVRSAIVESIAKYYRKKSFIFTLLRESALNDYEPLVRSASIRAINEYFPKNNEVDKILQLVIDRDIDRDIDDEHYPKAVAVKILKDRYR